jgi:hypothetical protein
MTAFPSETNVKITSPLGEQIGYSVLIQNAGLEGIEFRKLKTLYPRRVLSLSFENRTLAQANYLWAFYLSCKGPFTAFRYFFQKTDVYVQEYVGTGDGSTTIFNLPSKSAASYTMYSNGSSTSAYTFSSSGGTDGCDKATFSPAPASGAILTWSFTGQLVVRCRFKEQYMDFDTFYRTLVSSKISLQGLLNIE